MVSLRSAFFYKIFIDRIPSFDIRYSIFDIAFIKVSFIDQTRRFATPVGLTPNTRNLIYLVYLECGIYNLCSNPVLALNSSINASILSKQAGICAQ